MLRLTLVIVLIAAAASLKHVNKVKRNEDIWQKCYREKHPLYQCRPKDCTFPVYIALERVWRLEDMKRVLLAEDNLEQLCREAGTLLDCVTTAFNGASAECKEHYKGEPLTEELLSNGVAFLEYICDPDVIENIRSNLDCIMEENLLEDAEKCLRPNMDKNCSGIHYTTDYSIIRACYDEKYRKNCNAEDVVDCASKKVAASCDEDAGNLAELIGNAIFNTLQYPICPGGTDLQTILKYFKK